MTDPQPLSDADLLAWSVVLAYRGVQQKQGLTILLLPFPPCPTCGGVVYGADSVTVERGISRTATLTLRPCGHVHTATDDDLYRIHEHVGDMIDAMEDADNGRRQYDSWLPKDRPFRTEDVIREARARTGAPPGPLPGPAQFGSDGCTCRPFTTDPPRYLQPGDSVGREASWQRGTDCVHHAAEAERDEDALADFDRNPAALAWARSKVQGYMDQLADWERQADERGATDKARGIAVSRLLAQRRFIGGGCTIGAFDERRPGYLKITDTAKETP